MSKHKNHNLNLPTHFAEEDFVLYLDGELAVEEMEQSRRHLDSCWECRSRLKIVQESIDNFMQFRADYILPRDLPPAPPENDLFRQRLSAHINKGNSIKKSNGIFSLLGENIKNLLTSLKSEFYNLSPFNIKVGISAVCVVLIVSLFLSQLGVTSISANDLLNNSIEIQKQKLLKTSQPVIYQKILIKQNIGEKSLANKEETLEVETWIDTQQSRYRKNFNGQNLSKTNKNISLKVIEQPKLLVELSSILQNNRMDVVHPLKAESFKTWRDSLAQKQDVIDETTKETDGTISLKTTSTAQIETGKISEAVLTVRNSDWHPIKLEINYQTENGQQSFQIIEQKSDVVSLNSLSPEIFGTPELVKIIPPKVELSPSPELKEPTPQTVENNSNNVVTSQPEINQPVPAEVKANADLEIEVLRLLSDVNADLGEQIEVKRTSDGKLLVSGIVDSAKRKTEILNALSSVSKNSAVKIDILTGQEVVARQKSDKNSPAQETVKENVEIETDSTAVDNELKQYFNKQGADADAASRRFASNIVSTSRNATSHLWAMKKLANQFSQADEAKLTPEAKAKWLDLIRRHAASFREQSAAIRRQLKPIFFAGADETSGQSGGAINTNAEMKRAIQQLTDIGIANDSIIRSAFTASSGGFKITAAKSPQFWQELKNAEALAKKLQEIK